MPEVAEREREPQGLGALVKKRWRGWLRAIHRDLGYLAVGFTLIYALSGIAINHIKDWDPNFHATEQHADDRADPRRRHRRRGGRSA